MKKNQIETAKEKMNRSIFGNKLKYRMKMLLRHVLASNEHGDERKKNLWR